MSATDNSANLAKAAKASLRGRSAELLVAAAACEMGHTAALVLSFYAKYDLLIDTGPRILRVQVKLAQWIPQRQRPAGAGDRAHWQAGLRRQSNEPGNASRRKYTATDFDILAVVCEPGRIYFFPTSAILGPDGRLFGQVRIKPDGALSRADAKQSAERWAKYLNTLPEEAQP